MKTAELPCVVPVSCIFLYLLCFNSCEIYGSGTALFLWIIKSVPWIIIRIHLCRSSGSGIGNRSARPGRDRSGRTLSLSSRRPELSVGEQSVGRSRLGRGRCRLSGDEQPGSVRFPVLVLPAVGISPCAPGYPCGAARLCGGPLLFRVPGRKAAAGCASAPPLPQRFMRFSATIGRSFRSPETLKEDA